ncbi:hypothetical protein [Mesorhizobium sp. STM 4661]|uniref:hypothetical protein n=1 Tax=Mesorhizobium sp. STM 4661 TaxID=1297570 RepID=UPI0002BF9B87|nr:hypothetical protein [Mesorhizobium sp. STM 4661]CCV16403.1 conserved hypothetical protein [Mesorhizobium sp. STM 4661]
MQVTVKRRENVDPEHAVIHVAHLRSDAEAYCRDYEHTSSRACIDREMGQSFPAQIEANCKTGSFTTLSGKKQDGLRRAGRRSPKT